MSIQLAAHQRPTNVLMVVAAVVAVSRTVLLAVPEPLPWLAEAGEFLYDLAVAYATAWTFQLLVISMPAQQRQDAFERIVAPRVDALAANGQDLGRAIRSQEESQAALLPAISGVSKALAATSPDQEAPGWAITWLELIRHLVSGAAASRHALRPFYPRMSEELLALLER